jgi:hypothetical protein
LEIFCKIDDDNPKEIESKSGGAPHSKLWGMQGAAAV